MFPWNQGEDGPTLKYAENTIFWLGKVTKKEGALHGAPSAQQYFVPSGQ